MRHEPAEERLCRKVKRLENVVGIEGERRSRTWSSKTGQRHEPSHR